MVSILLGVGHIVAGVGLLLPEPGRVVVGWVVEPTATLTFTATVTPTRPPMATAAPTRTPSPTARPSPTVAPLPTLAMLSIPTETPLPTPTPTPGPRDAPEEAAFSLTIVHTNDTWGYTRPCG